MLLYPDRTKSTIEKAVEDRIGEKVSWYGIGLMGRLRKMRI